MIIVKLQGGLGNQLFQWAYGKSLSLQLNKQLYLDLSFLMSTHAGITKRDYELHHFDKIEDQTIQRLFDVKYAHITDNNYLFLYKPVNYNYYIDGYFQNEKYFSQFKNYIKDTLVPKKELLLNINDIAKNIKECNSLSLHVRRTDYLHNSYHKVKTLDYYENAINQIQDYDKLFVFSDDIDWCKTNLKFNNIIFVENLINAQDLYLMSLCKHNIIANSSFSWWAAWLNPNENKKVVCPEDWFYGIKASMFVQDSWIKI
jgi:hypothetical protein